jgi:hypothetical protein
MVRSPDRTMPIETASEIPKMSTAALRDLVHELSEYTSNHFDNMAPETQAFFERALDAALRELNRRDQEWMRGTFPADQPLGRE